MGRLTIVLRDDLEKKLRNIQANEIRKTQGTVSFSKVINDTLDKAL